MDWTTNPLVALYFAVRNRNSMIAASRSTAQLRPDQRSPALFGFQAQPATGNQTGGDTFTQTSKEDAGYADFGIDDTIAKNPGKPATKKPESMHRYGNRQD